ncbi:MAG TPA: hypothetical protein VI959_03360 [Alphaproteobacteria bacterium]|nr:hypothetical protein [Alphaproteobacteria bacterium]
MRLKAFSLLEAVLALSVVGLVATFTFPLVEQMLLLKNHETTKTKMERIIYALSGFVLSQKHLPCPATSLESGDTLLDCTGSFKGFVPYKSLGLSEKDVCDGKGKPFIYGVNPSLTIPHDLLMFAPGLELEITGADGQLWCEATGNDLNLQGVEMPSHDTLAVVLSTTSTLSVHDIFDFTFKKDIPKEQVLYVSRNTLMASYAHLPCIRMPEQ